MKISFDKEMVNIDVWVDSFTCKLKSVFENRIEFIGLQGSYGRGEASRTSDIDIVVILDKLQASDIQIYNDMLNTMPHRELICGFVSGKAELLNWEPSDLFQFYYDTTQIVGSIDYLLPLIDDTAVTRAIKIGACNIYHGCVHNMLHEKSEDILKGLYKAATFVVQAIVFKQTKRYIKSKEALLAVAELPERAIIDNFLRYKSCESVDFDMASQSLFGWAKRWITTI
ncbi:MAG: nucleotidyltransferase domain-containing protein [Alistipes sp.]|nr:nucleotidyltransferase domain-containing protein [Alistipes sp.]